MSWQPSLVQPGCPAASSWWPVLLRARPPLGQTDERFFGPQVPGEHPVQWIAERAPPRCS